jgi:hypothetical protein
LNIKGKKKALAERLAKYHRQLDDNSAEAPEPESGAYEARPEDYRDGLSIDYRMTCIDHASMSGKSAKRFWDMLCSTWDDESEENHSLRIQQQIPMNGDPAKLAAAAEVAAPQGLERDNIDERVEVQVWD